MRRIVPALDDRTFRHARWSAPLLSALLLVGMLAFGTVSVRPPEGLDEYHARVRDAVAAVPIRIQGWVARPIEPTPSATKLLRPNVISQRQYVELEGARTLSLLIVHCGDARDMYGHYPPNCYPNSGWTRDRSTPRSLDLPEGPLPVHDYRFSREGLNETDRLRVVNFFVLPDADEPVHRGIEAIQGASRSPTASGLGAGQIQLVITEDIDNPDWDSVIERFATELAPTIHEMGRGPDAS